MSGEARPDEEAMLRQSYAEGAYEGFLAGRRAVEE